MCLIWHRRRKILRPKLTLFFHSSSKNKNKYFWKIQQKNCEIEKHLNFLPLKHNNHQVYFLLNFGLTCGCCRSLTRMSSLLHSARAQRLWQMWNSLENMEVNETFMPTNIPAGCRALQTSRLIKVLLLLVSEPGERRLTICDPFYPPRSPSCAWRWCSAVQHQKTMSSLHTEVDVDTEPREPRVTTPADTINWFVDSSISF